MNKTAFEEAIASIEDHGSYSIACNVVMRIKNAMNEMKKEVDHAIDNGRPDACPIIVANADRLISGELSAMMTAMDRMDVATIRLLTDIENVFHGLESIKNG
jgi:hypothetical protein